MSGHLLLYIYVAMSESSHFESWTVFNR